MILYLISLAASDTVRVAYVSGVFALITAVIGAFVALSVNRNEKTKTSETTIEKTLRQEISIRDQRLKLAVEQRDDALHDLEEMTMERNRLQAAIDSQRAEERILTDDAHTR